MSELEIVGVVFSVVVGIAIIVIAFNVVAIRRSLTPKADRTDERTAPRP